MSSWTTSGRKLNPWGKYQNFREETKEVMDSYGVLPANVRWVGCPYFWMTWDEFFATTNFDYDDGFGRQMIAPNLVIVGDDWWIERGEYDGSEWWDFKTLPERPGVHHVPVSPIAHDDRSWTDDQRWTVIEIRDQDGEDF